ncbi:hypothetical protein [Altererythrobacter sp.]|nr:hypothetical protein [Altererythrobacter sp.]MBO6642941.1 hypothetical protein [Altererythrobacter sp.]MBO6709684.1 hypothetical protein [Altererythrobacter sp.]
MPYESVGLAFDLLNGWSTERLKSLIQVVIGWIFMAANGGACRDRKHARD